MSNLGSLTVHEARAYLRAAHDDELAAAVSLALDRNLLEGVERMPDEIEVHHALFLLRHARGLDTPSFDSMRVELRKTRMIAA